MSAAELQQVPLGAAELQPYEIRGFGTEYERSGLGLSLDGTTVKRTTLDYILLDSWPSESFKTGMIMN